MQITEVRIKLMDASADRLRAFCSITIDDAFVVRDLKIIDGATGPFVAMPSRKLTVHCSNCGSKNHLRANHCNQCGARQPSNRPVHDDDGRARLYADIAHPINSDCREMIQSKVIETYQQELELAKEPGYVSRYDEFDADYDETDAENQSPESKAEKDAPLKADTEKSEGNQPSSQRDALGKVPDAPEKQLPKAEPSEPKPRKPKTVKDKPEAEKRAAEDSTAKQTPHSKEMDQSKERKTPWQNRPDDEFGAGIF